MTEGTTTPADGHPVPPLPPGDWQVIEALGPGLLASGGRNSALAETIAEDTGDIVGPGYRTLGFLDGEGRSLAFALHDGLGVEPGTAEVSGSDGGLPWSLPVLRTLARCLFALGGLSAVTVRARPDDAGLHALLARLGFDDLGRDDRPGRFGRRIFVLTDRRAARFLPRHPAKVS